MPKIAQTNAQGDGCALLVRSIGCQHVKNSLPVIVPYMSPLDMDVEDFGASEHSRQGAARNCGKRSCAVTGIM